MDNEFKKMLQREIAKSDKLVKASIKTLKENRAHMTNTEFITLLKATQRGINKRTILKRMKAAYRKG